MNDAETFLPAAKAKLLTVRLDTYSSSHVFQISKMWIGRTKIWKGGRNILKRTENSQPSRKKCYNRELLGHQDLLRV